jgi:uncharacterized SAM-binding protein YcdF (DUF218 family)
MNLYFYASKILAPLILPSNFLILALIVFFYLGVWNNKEKFKKIFYIFFLIFSIISIFPMGNFLINHGLEKSYRNSKLPNRLDYIFVPSGNYERIITAIKIRKNYLPNEVKIIYSHGDATIDKKNSNNKIYNELVQTIISISNIDKKDIVSLPDARNTIENFKQLNKYLSGDKSKKILLVTNAFHMKRSLVIAEKYKIQVQAFPSSFYTSNRYFSLINYYQGMSFQKNLFYFDVFVRELLGIFAVKVVL